MNVNDLMKMKTERQNKTKQKAKTLVAIQETQGRVGGCWSRVGWDGGLPQKEPRLPMS